MSLVSRKPAGLLSRLARFNRDVRGVAVVEFAFVAPILIFFYFGMAETCQLLMAQRRVSHTAAALADLVAQDTQIGEAEVKQLYEAGCTILRPFPVGKLRIRLSSVVLDSTKTKKVVAWSQDNDRTLNKHAPDADLTARVETPLENVGDGVVLAEVEYDHFSPIGHFLPGVTKVTHKAEMRPRRSAAVAWVPGTAAAPTGARCFGGA
jgi:Flp pilus assembly protein TadG